MKKSTILVIFLFIFVLIRAQQFTDEKYALTTTATSVGAGFITLLDPYLSPYEYKGFEMRIENKSRRFFNPDNDKLSYSHRMYLELGKGNHPSGKNSMLFFNTNYMYGLNYHMRPVENLMILAGGSWDIDLGGKYLGRNVNNPFSLDFFSDLNATAEIQYELDLKNRSIRIQYGAVCPVAGFMFVPMQNVSYYELFVLDNTKNAFHFSSVHNKRAWYQYLNLDIPFKSNTLRLSLQHDYQKYSANEVIYRKNAISLSVGAVMHLYTFRGNKDRIPTHFIHSYE